MEEHIHNLGLSHAVFAKAVVPLVRDSLDSGYVIITGGTGASAPRVRVRVRFKD